MDTPVTFGEWLRQKRSELRLTRGEFADRVGCSVSMLRKIEDSERRPSDQIAGLIANSLDIPEPDRPTFVRVARGELGVERLFPKTPNSSTSNVSPTQPHAHINLPVLPTPFVGRQSDMLELIQLLSSPDCHLLTLVGPGGIGKTRMAVEVASQMQPFFSDGVYYVPFAQVLSSRFIVPVIAEAIGFAFQRENFVDPKLQLFSYLQEKQLLLVLDNLEHLLPEPGIELLSELIEHAQQVKLLATSRESLGLYGEWIYEVQGLPVPEIEHPEAFGQGTSVELFLQRAKRANFSFTATDQDYPAIVRICQHVDGMPLGIELAAAWVRTLSCEDIAGEIERDLDFLKTSMRDFPARHRSMRLIFDHSWRLLSNAEQEVLLRLSVFQGGFTRKGAEVVAGANIPTLSALVTKSLVRRNAADRYDLHELIRQYASERFADQPAEKAQTQELHGFFYLTSFSDEDMGLRSFTQGEAIARLTTEMDNFRTAWHWAVSHGEFSIIERTLRAFATFFDNRGWFQEGLELLDQARIALENRFKDSAPDRNELLVLGHLLTCGGLLTFRISQNDQAQAMLEQSIDILRSLDVPGVLVESVTFLGIVMALKGDIAQALELFREGLKIAKKIGDRWFAALCFTEKISMMMMSGKGENAYVQLQSAVKDWRSIGDPRFTGFGLNLLSLSAYRLERFDEARLALEESIVLNSSVGDRWGLGSAYRGLGLVAQAQSHHEQALEAFHKSRDILTDLGARWDLARVLSEMGSSVFALGRDAEAEAIWREALRLSLETQGTHIGLEALAGYAGLQAKRGYIEQAIEISIFVIDHPASVQETKNRAAQLHAQLESRLTPQEIDGIQRRARANTLDSLAEYILS
jgi:predicted ATPase/transcriptional regulator with XRE-family HTH domain